MRTNKKGQLFGAVTGVIAGVIGVIFLVLFAYIFISNLNVPSLLPTASVGAQAINNMTGNFTTGVNQISSTIPTAFAIATFVLVVVLLVIAYGYARKNGLLGGGTLG